MKTTLERKRGYKWPVRRTARGDWSSSRCISRGSVYQFGRKHLFIAPGARDIAAMGGSEVKVSGAGLHDRRTVNVGTHLPKGDQ